MRYILNISLDKDLEYDYCRIDKAKKDKNLLCLYIYTNGKEPIDFKKMRYISFYKINYKGIVEDLKTKRGIRNKIGVVYLNDSSFEYMNSKEQNEALADILKNNPALANKRVFASTGSPRYDADGIDAISPFDNYKSTLVTMEELQFQVTAAEARATYEIANGVMKRLEGHEFSLLEKMLYTYDIIRTNFAIDEKYNKLMNSAIKCYDEPSPFYTILYKIVLDRLHVRNLYSVADYNRSQFNSYERAINLAYVNDPELGVEGIYFFDLTRDSRYAFDRIFPGNEDKDLYRENFINNYISFCKTRSAMAHEIGLEEEHMLNDADEDLAEEIQAAFKEDGIKAFYDECYLINMLAKLVDDEILFSPSKGILPNEVDYIQTSIERYSYLFGKDINAETFLEALFNVRRELFMENSHLFPLDEENLRECMLQSAFTFSSLTEDNVNMPDMSKREQEEAFVDLFEELFDNAMEKQGYEKEIKKLHLIMQKEETPKDDDK